MRLTPLFFRPRLLACAAGLLALCLLGGCLPKTKAWTHPREANPRKEDKLFEEDTKFCEDKIGPQIQGAAQGAAREAALADCLKRLGWVPKEKE